MDQKVTEVFLSAVTPGELDLSLAVLKETERQSAEVDRQWKLRLERAPYETIRAERQYHAVEPENRIVARTLETRWNQKLQELLQVEAEYEQARRVHKLNLSDEDKRAIVALSKDLPKVWHADSTAVAERKQLLRLLIEDIVLLPVETPQRSIQIRILWKTGAITETVVPRPKPGEHCKTPAAAVTLIREQANEGNTDAQIADTLNRQCIKNGHGGEFTLHSVHWIRLNYGIPSRRSKGVTERRSPPHRDAHGLYSFPGLAAHFGVSIHRVRYWVRRNVLTPQRGTPGGPSWFELTSDVQARVAEAMRTGYGSGKKKT